jgi:hypothetical protein
MSTITHRAHAARAAGKEWREHTVVRALRDHQAEQEAVRDRTAYLRALRLAKETQAAAELQRQRQAIMAGLKARARKAAK